MGENAVHDRRLLLAGTKRNAVLTLDEVRAYGLDCFGDRDYVSVYGMRPAEWYARGIRLLGRTAVECTRDRLAQLIASDVARVVRAAPPVGGLVAIDPFAGSANTLYWLKHVLGASRAVGFELDAAVFDTTRRNLALAEIAVDYSRTDYEAGLAALEVPDDRLPVVFIAPPWGDALSESAGLDLGATSPAVAEVVEAVADALPARPIVFAIQVYERLEPSSLRAATARFDWASVEIYDIDPPGRNHGVVLATTGWSPQT